MNYSEKVHSNGGREVKLSMYLIKHYAMKKYGRVEV
jgi:hypothetical protein